MFEFDLTQEPLTNVELKEQQEKVKALRKELIKYSCISDVFHAFIYIGLYFSQLLSGYAILAAVGLSTACAAIVATATRSKLDRGDLFTTTIIALGAASANVFILHLTMHQPLSGSIIAGILSGSIVIVGATLGRKIKQVINLGEDLKSIADDTLAQQELATLCRNNPVLSDYREQAACYLRPQLTYGELKAMRDYARSKGS